MKAWKPQTGFTLAELLIALAILGVIAAFSIPKILGAQQNAQYNANAKEVMAALSEALQKYKYTYGIVPGVSLDSDLFQYINYLSYDTSSQIDNYTPFTAAVTCSVSAPCIRLHNGGLLRAGGVSWYDTNTTSSLSFLFDPDGQYTGKVDSLNFNLYPDGAVRTRDTIRPNTTGSTGGTRSPNAPNTHTQDPLWFDW